MINNIFIWGSKSYALLIDEILKNRTKSINLKYLKSNSKNLKVKIVFDPYAKKQSYKFHLRVVVCGIDASSFQW